MEKLGPKYIGEVTLTSVRGWILDNSLTEYDTVMLHPANMQTVLADYRQLYREPMPDPYFLLGVLIDGTGEVYVPENRVLALLNDARTNRPSRQASLETEATEDGGNVFRCEHCGRMVNEHGVMLEGSEQAHAISLLRLRDGRGAIPVEGECCQSQEDE